MRATDILSEEHRLIEQVLNCLEKLADDAAATGRLDHKSALEALEFLETYADGCHHQKEEGHLFPTLERRGMSRDYGPTGEMLSEHTTGREHILAMRASAEASARGDRHAPARFSRETRLYLHLAREHVLKEDQCLFTVANDLLTAADHDLLVASFRRVESERLGQGLREKYVNLVTRLADQLGVQKVVAPNVLGGGRPSTGR